MTKNFMSLAPGALLVFALAGCSHHASTASSVTAPADAATTTSNTNTFGDDKSKAAGNAEHARDQSYGSSTEANPPAPRSDEPNTAANPK